MPPHPIAAALSRQISLSSLIWPIWLLGLIIACAAACVPRSLDGERRDDASAPSATHVASEKAPADEDIGHYSGPLPIVAGAHLPPPSEETFVFAVTRDGRISHAGRRLTFDQLHDELGSFARPLRDPAFKDLAMPISRARVHARLHPDLPYAVLTRILRLCCANDVRLYRFHLAVRPREEGPEQALPLFLRVDRCEDDLHPPPRFGIELRLRHKRPPTDLPVLAQRLTALRQAPELQESPRPSLLIEAGPHVRLETIARVAFLGRKASFTEISFAGTEEPGSTTAGQRGGCDPADPLDLVDLVARHGKRSIEEPGYMLSGPVPADLLELVEEEEDEEGEGERAPREPGRPDPRRYRERDRPPCGADVPGKVAIGLALHWLARHQEQDGRWDRDGFATHEAEQAVDGSGPPADDIAVTALALLAFLGDGDTMRRGPYRDVVQKAVAWLLTQQGPNGLFGRRTDVEHVRAHAFATLALCEAHGSAADEPRLRASAQLAVDFLEFHRYPAGGWSVGPLDPDPDLGLTHWCTAAFVTARDFGLDVNDTALEHVAHLVDRDTDVPTGRWRGTSCVEEVDMDANGDLPLNSEKTASALFLRCLLGQDPDREPVMRRAADLLLRHAPPWQAAAEDEETENGPVATDFAYWYAASHAMHRMGGTHWDCWREALFAAVLGNQRKDGRLAGSWDSAGTGPGIAGSRVHSTAICTLTLASSRRYAWASRR